MVNEKALCALKRGVPRDGLTADGGLPILSRRDVRLLVIHCYSEETWKLFQWGISQGEGNFSMRLDDISS